jgi:hypothetical protein
MVVLTGAWARHPSERSALRSSYADVTPPERGHVREGTTTARTRRIGPLSARDTPRTWGKRRAPLQVSRAGGEHQCRMAPIT